MTFKKGQSGNPSGRPKGIKDKRLRFRDMLEPHAGALIEKLVNEALAGDMSALKICIDKLLPTPKSESVNIPSLGQGALSEQGAAILAAIGAAELEPHTGASLISALTGQAKIMETSEIMDRLEALEREHDN